MTDRDVALPEIGEGAHLSFDVAAMEALHKKYRDNYINDVLAGLDRHDISTFKAALEAMTRGTEATAAEIVNAFTMTELAMRIADAISLRINGKTFKAQQAEKMSGVIDKARDDIREITEAQ